MQLERYNEIINWIHSNFSQENFLIDTIEKKITELQNKLPSEYTIECSDSPDFILVNDSPMDTDESGTKRTRRDIMLNPFVYLILIAASKAISDNVLNEVNKNKKVCSNCQKENPNEAKHCMECGNKF
ncbi:MAG TPA: zinc ribbon domain-containing protein [Nitrososphaeraceae archaeon]|jgi:ribosomal protein L40E|nr:zinc ribbon domain-containing protein [Nitrososphaeraceae archaeon]